MALWLPGRVRHVRSLFRRCILGVHIFLLSPQPFCDRCIVFNLCLSSDRANQEQGHVGYFVYMNKVLQTGK